MKLFWLILLIAIFLFYTGNQNVGHALSCEGPITTQSSYEDSDVVFLGEVISKKYVPSSIEDFQDSLVKFKVKESFKGISNETLTIQTSEYFWSAIFNEGNEYVVFAYDSDGILGDQLCTLNSTPDEIDLEQLRKLSDKGSDAEELGPNDFETCEGFLSVDEVKSTIGYDGQITQEARGLTPVDEPFGLKTMCGSTFESADGTIGMTLVVMDSVDTAIELYVENRNSILLHKTLRLENTLPFGIILMLY